MDRVTVRGLKKRDLSNADIASQLGMHRNTVARLLAEPADKEYEQRAVYNSTTWFEALLEIEQVSFGYER